MYLPPALDRFLTAQEPIWEWVLAELKAGKKRSHWMWFVFPQFRGLGNSDKAKRYAIQSRAEAIAFLEHGILGGRIRECCALLLQLDSSSAHEVFGSPDDVKLRSCMTLFCEVSDPGNLFEGMLMKFFDGERDARTLELLA